MSKLKFFCVPQGGKQVWETMSNLFQYSLNIKYIYIIALAIKRNVNTWMSHKLVRNDCRHYV